MTKEELKQVDEMTIEILQHLNDMLTDEDCEHYIILTAENATVFFHCVKQCSMRNDIEVYR